MAQNIIDILNYKVKEEIRFSKFVELFLEDPKDHLKTSASLLLDSINHFGFDIVIRNGEPYISHNIFNDIFSEGINAIYGHEYCIKEIVDIIESVDREAGPNRGLLLVGPPGSGKTNIVDLISRSLEEYTKRKEIKLYTFYFKFSSDDGRFVELRNLFIHNPILLFPIVIERDNEIFYPRKELFGKIKNKEKISIPIFYQNANLDKKTLDIVEGLMKSPRNKNKTLYEILEEYVRIEEIEFSINQGKGISNIDDMINLSTTIEKQRLDMDDIKIIKEHLPENEIYKYKSSIICSNRGIIHIHDAFDPENDEKVFMKQYRPLLMLLGSGKVSMESTQSQIDNITILTTNIEEMEFLEECFSNSKILDRIEKIPVNYLTNISSEIDILKRDMSNIKNKYDLDPNLFKIASFYSIMTRLFPPGTDTEFFRDSIPEDWEKEKIEFYMDLAPEQKLFIYSSKDQDPINTIKNLPYWHPFQEELRKRGIDVKNPKQYEKHIKQHPEEIDLKSCGLFTDDQLKFIDNEFKSFLKEEHYPKEGKYGLSIRQLQNIMRSTIINSNNNKVTVRNFLEELKKIIDEGLYKNPWLKMNYYEFSQGARSCKRYIGEDFYNEDRGKYGDFIGLIDITESLYKLNIKKEITICLTDRNPEQIEGDLRKYLQYIMLNKAIQNKRFSYIMVPQYTFIDKVSGKKVDQPDYDFMDAIEKILNGRAIQTLAFREKIANKFLSFQNKKELKLNKGKTIFDSRDDNLLECFSKEYSKLLSHRRRIENVDVNELKNAFFHKQNNKLDYNNYSDDIKNIVEKVIQNMITNFNYSYDTALDTVIFALRQEIIDINKIIK